MFCCLCLTPRSFLVISSDQTKMISCHHAMSTYTSLLTQFFHFVLWNDASTDLQKFHELLLTDHLGSCFIRTVRQSLLPSAVLWASKLQYYPVMMLNVWFISIVWPQMMIRSTDTQLSSDIRVPSWSENWTVYQSVSLARSWLFLAVRAGEHNFSNHHDDDDDDDCDVCQAVMIKRTFCLRSLTASTLRRPQLRLLMPYRAAWYLTSTVVC